MMASLCIFSMVLSLCGFGWIVTEEFRCGEMIMIDAVIGFLNTLFWSYILVYGLLAVGVFFTLRLGFIQFFQFGEMFRVVFAARRKDGAGISPFQALSVSLASRVGVGNLAGVAVALHLGGAGAIFWMWLMALFGMATAYAESTLGQLYKTTNHDGRYRGGPAFYIGRGLKAPWAGVLFSLALILSFGLVFNAVQANAIAGAMNFAFDVPLWATGLVVAACAGVVIFGGIRQVAKVAALVVPVMSFFYVLLVLVILVMNITAVPDMLKLIVLSAFGLQEAAGGIMGGLTAAMLNGVKRGMFSNEAGMGSVPNIAACATPSPHHPASQGFVQALGVFLDTIVICTATAVMILLSGIFLEPGADLKGIEITQMALAAHVGAIGNYFVAVAILFFAFTSIIGNYTYAENALTYIGCAGRTGVMLLRAGLVLMVFWGAQQTVQRVFDAADASMGLMATINLVAIVLLSGTVVKLTRDYLRQKKEGGDPCFDLGDYPELEDRIDTEVWTKR
ncbi:alanine:cation symporter family protein [Desulfobotulus sp. H1]|uniref:Alanine:cation symporter family protein n=1 Tax=Desulfobotulus pelophilus TaxID=2823377 RepID=A0ABT3NAK9_9BACT|nr:sodium:alanine symporter family protein [Desulfobotulus pelophilus]MCW7754497.1 alanine:cation symporter family protein [Desulfobotulus pelophilus]